MDKYDAAIAYLKDNPTKINTAWNQPMDQQGGCLFDFAQRTPRWYPEDGVGCLTQIRADAKQGFRNPRGVEARPDLTAEIVEDERIPVNPYNITVDDLHVFAEWQRRLDVELNRK